MGTRYEIEKRAGETTAEAAPADADLLRQRQQAAAFLRAARLTFDARERRELRRKAVELLTPAPRRANGKA
jgi:hypothetical protein